MSDGYAGASGSAAQLLRFLGQQGLYRRQNNHFVLLGRLVWGTYFQGILITSQDFFQLSKSEIWESSSVSPASHLLHLYFLSSAISQDALSPLVLTTRHPSPLFHSYCCLFPRKLQMAFSIVPRLNDPAARALSKCQSPP